jgi:putative peptidoglycan lipid II flippase
VFPSAVFLAVLRIPIVRLVFGAARFTWASTVETGYTLSAFCLGIFAQALIYLLTRAFYSLHDTATPVKVAVGSIFLNASLSFIFVLGLHWPIWSLALSYSISSILQALMLIVLLDRKVGGLVGKKIAYPFSKIVLASSVAGGTMFFLLKVFDYSVWHKNLSFLGRFGLTLPTTFDRFVLDTRYTVNLLLLTVFVILVGILVYSTLAWLLKIEEVAVFSRLLKRLRKVREFLPLSKTSSKKEAITVEAD